MKVFRAHASPFRAADVKTFHGPADTRLLAASDEGTPVHVYEVRFQPEDGPPGTPIRARTDRRPDVAAFIWPSTSM